MAMDWSKLLGGLGVGGIGAATLGNIFKKDKTEDPMKYLNQIPDMARQQLDPYVQRGNQAHEMAQGQYNQMTQNPTDFLNQLMSGYQPSQGYQYRSNVLNRDMGNTAAAGGFAGTQEDQRQRAELINSLMGQDMQQYLGNVLGIQGTGLQGQEYTQNRGFGASTDLANILGTNLTQQAGLRFKQGQQRQQDKSGWMKLLPSILGAGIGALSGGPGGALAGFQAGQGIGSAFGGGNNSGVVGNF